MSDPDSDSNLAPGGQRDERDELLAELDVLLDRGASCNAITPEQRRTFRLYVAEHEGEIEWLREQCRKLEEGLISPDEAQKWFDAFVAMEGEDAV